MTRFIVGIACGALLCGFAVTDKEPRSTFAREMLAAHNAVRQKTGVAPLKWSATLAARAEEWAKTLAASGAARMQGIAGQNIGYTSPGRATAAAMVGAWAAEADNYDREKNACIDRQRSCHHYTQVVWRNSAYLGCAVAHDDERDIWVCDYDPPGNNVAERPY